MNTPRGEASSIVTANGKLIISGGFNKNEGPLFDTEIINVPESKTEEGFVLPKEISEYCSVLINATTMMVLGGRNASSSAQKSTYFIDLDTFQVTVGPEMQETRGRFGCAVFEHNQQNFLIAAGGSPPDVRDSIEFLSLDSTRLRWSKGKIPFSGLGQKKYQIYFSFNFQDLHCLFKWLSFRPFH